MPITGHLQSVAVDGSRTSGCIVGAGPVMPAGVGVGRIGVQTITEKVAGEFIIAPEPHVQAVIGAIRALSNYKHIPATGRVPFGPQGHSERFVGQVNSVAGIQGIIAAVELDSVADHAVLPGLGATATGAGGVAGRHVAGKVAKRGGAAALVEGQP